MPALILASFPNSRIKPRDARTTGQAVIVSCPPGVTQILPSDNNRTDLTIRNLDSLQTIFYGFTNTVNGTTIGFELLAQEGKDIDGPQAIYIYNPGGVAVSVCYDVGQG